MEIEPENQDQNQKPETETQPDKNNEDLAKQIPTVTPDSENEIVTPDTDDEQ